jgi:beta-aspartyl-dipeptidase (metallo-type)
MIVLKNLEIYSPEYLGRKDILIGGNKIVAIEDSIEIGNTIKYEMIDCTDLIALPGIIDSHAHIAGAGGEGGPATRTPEITLSQLIEGGVTTVIGCLGTDGFTRSPESVLMKVKSLREEGISSWMYTGSYQVPTPTITGDVGRDLALLDEVIGVGEVALSDHRSSFPSTHELVRLAEHSRVGAMLGNKSGILNIHMGDAIDPFKPLYDAVEISELNLKQFYPTHCGRNREIFEASKEYGKIGFIDFTASSYRFFPQYEIKPSEAIYQLLECGVPIEHITISSDGNGSLPDFDEDGKLIKLEIGQPSSIFEELIDMVERGISKEDSFKTVTSNVADILKLQNKGRIEVGKDGDIILLNDKMDIIHLIAMGKLLKKDGVIIKKGSYE